MSIMLMLRYLSDAIEQPRLETETERKTNGYALINLSSALYCAQIL